MKKFILLFIFGSCLFGCTLNSNESINHKQLLLDIQSTMPLEIYNELQKNGYFSQIDNTLSIANDEHNPTLRLDFTYKNNILVNYVAKEYGFIDNMKNQTINEEEAMTLAKQFAKIFLQKNILLEKTDNLNDYIGKKYITFKDNENNIYLVQLNKNMIIKYINNS